MGVYSVLSGKNKKSSSASTAAANESSTSNESNKPRNRQKVLLLSSRGIPFRHRHLVSDLESLLPQCKRESKLDTKSNLWVLNELAELNSCNNCLFFESKKNEDLYLWMSKTPNGPCVRFHVQNIHTMDEMRMTGNCLKGSRPLLSFDKTFDSKPHYQLLKEMLIQSFGVPKSSRRVKPFHDHIFNFAIVDGRIWFRNYQIVEKDNAGTVLPIDEETNKILTNAENGDDDDEPSGKNKKKATEQDLTMVEIGPRFCLNPIKIFAGSFGGPTLYENQAYVSPNAVRAELRGRKGAKYVQRHMAESERKIRLDHSDLPQDARDSIFANNDNDDDDDE